MIWSVAWKNVWRNKRRSLVVISAVTIGIISGVLLIGIMKGWVVQRLDDAILNEVSHIQIHNPEYIKNEEIGHTVQKPDDLAVLIGSMEETTAWVKRTKMTGMAVTPWANAGVVIYGIVPEKERQVTHIHRQIIPGAGTYLEGGSSGEILISDKTAEILKLKHYILTEKATDRLKEQQFPSHVLDKLASMIEKRFRSPREFREALEKILDKKEVKEYASAIMKVSIDYRIRNKIQLTISDAGGTPVQGIFRVCGIYKTTNTGFDQAAVFVGAASLAALYGGSEVMTHEIAILLNDIKDAGEVRDKLSSLSHGNSVRTWKELAPDVAMVEDYMVLYYVIFIGIIMLALAFGIINTMLMSILERTRELGMLMAIGMNRKRVFRMIMLETIFLTSVGAVAGMGSGWLIISILGRTGIHFSGWGEGFEAIGYAARVYPEVGPDFFLLTTLMVIVTAIVSSLWPARKALNLKPVEALRSE
jgi:ABC-type lipoprotein release transport system permease subunit